MHDQIAKRLNNNSKSIAWRLLSDIIGGIPIIIYDNNHNFYSKNQNSFKKKLDFLLFTPDSDCFLEVYSTNLSQNANYKKVIVMKKSRIDFCTNLLNIDINIKFDCKNSGEWICIDVIDLSPVEIQILMGVFDTKFTKDELCAELSRITRKINKNIDKNINFFDFFHDWLSQEKINALREISYYSELVPAFLFVSNFCDGINNDSNLEIIYRSDCNSHSDYDNSDIFPQLIKYRIDEFINICASFANFPVEKITSSDIELHNEDNLCVKAELIVFRHFYKEHYAIMINNNIFNNKDNKNDTYYNKDNKNDTKNNIAPLVRIHSSCFTGDLIRSMRCDCYAQLHSAIDEISRSQNGGAVIYLNQEGRSIGLSNKVRAYYLQQAHELDTVDANRAIGFADDQRDFVVAASIMKLIGMNKIELLTNNPDKLRNIKDSGIEIIACRPHVSSDSDKLRSYYKTKARKLKHDILIQFSD